MRWWRHQREYDIKLLNYHCIDYWLLNLKDFPLDKGNNTDVRRDSQQLFTSQHGDEPSADFCTSHQKFPQSGRRSQFTEPLNIFIVT